MNDYEIGNKIYRIVTWDDYPRQLFEFHVIKSNLETGSNWEECKGFNLEKDAINYIEKIAKKERDL